MTDGVFTTTMARVSIADEVLVNRSGSSGRQAIQDLAQQLAGSGPIAQALTATSEGIQGASTWSQLAAAAADVGRLGRVTGPDAGTHNDPDTGQTVSNTGEYIKVAAGWKRTGDLINASAISGHIADRNNPHQVTADQVGLGDVNERIGVNVPLYGERPGDSPHNFVDTINGGDPISLAEMAVGVTVSDENGRVRRLTGAGLVATRVMYPLEPDRVYLVEFVIQRRVDTPDPANDAVRCALAWYNQTLGILTPAFTIVQDLTSLTTASGRRVVTATIARAAGGEIDIISPANARYVRPYVQGYGTSSVTDVEVTRWADITNATAYSPDLTALTGRVSAIESMDLGSRLSAVEATISAPTAFKVPNRAAIRAWDIPVSADVVETLGSMDPGDGGGARWFRSALEPSHTAKEPGVDGQWWEMREDTVDIRMFYAFPAKSDNTAEINNALAYAAGKKLFIPPYKFTTTDVLIGTDQIEIFGVRGKSQIYSVSLPDGGPGHGVRQMEFSGKVGWTVKNVLLDMSDFVPAPGTSPGVRCIWVADCSGHKILANDFKTPGAAVGSVRSSKYDILFNRSDFISATGFTYHDGIIDQWDGCNNFRVLFNWVNGGGVGKYGVLVTGQSTDGVANACYDFDIEVNEIERVTQMGIWSNGRQGVNYGLNISRNRIRNVANFHGIGASDSKDGRIQGNLIDGVNVNAIRLFSETSAGGSFGTSNLSLAGNVAKNTNQANSVAAFDGAAIAIQDTASNIAVSDNVVDGTKHTYALAIGSGTSNVQVGTNAFVAGVNGTIINNSPSNFVVEKAASGQYMPTVAGVPSTGNVATVTASQARYTRTNNIVRVTGSITITPATGNTAGVRTQATLTLPIPSNLGSSTTDMAGTGASTFGNVAGISADITNKVAIVTFMATSTGTFVFYYQYEYTIK